METNKMVWGLLMPLSYNWVRKPLENLIFDNDVWNKAVDECVKAGVNTIVIDLLDGLRYDSHPEIALEGAWTTEKLRSEVERLKNLGIAAIPKLNFSAMHCGWLKEYGDMISTPKYYEMCRDLIDEVSELFNNPKYIHLGMDEENEIHVRGRAELVYRQKEMLMHDLRYLCDCVKEKGSIPWIWSCPLFDYPEEFKAAVKTGEIVISPWMYNAIKKENYTSITARKEYVDWYNQEPYKSLNMTYVEEDPFIVDFMEKALPCVLDDGYDVIPCVSTVNKCIYNATDMMEYFKENAPKERVLGFITSPWWALSKENEAAILTDIKVFGLAKSKIYEGRECPELQKIDLYNGDIPDVVVY